MQFSHVFHQVRLQLRINLMVFNAQMPLNELNKSNGMFRKGNRRNKCRGRKKGFKEKGENRMPKIKNKQY